MVVDILRPILFTSGLLFAAPVEAKAEETDGGKAPAELQGVWKLTSVEVQGEPHDPLGGGTPRWIIVGKTIRYGGQEIARFTAEPSTNPHVIDLKFAEPERSYEGVYAVEKGTLKVCLNKRDGAKDRPIKLSTKDQPDSIMLTFEKEKTAPAKPTEGLMGFVGVALRAGEEKEVTVDAAIKGSAAEKAGLKKGDVILKIGGINASDLQKTVDSVRGNKPGSKLDIVIQRDGKEKTITVTVGVLPFQYVARLE